MQEEPDTCRICSAPAEPDQPLFYPCKCSGTIRYIHQDCLTTWLAHSKKKSCDVCNHPYTFAKVYDPNMPERLPFLLIIKRFAQHAFFAVLFVLRAIFVGSVWFAIIPWITIWTWRMYFLMGDSTAWWIAARDKPPSIPSNLPHANNGTLKDGASSARPNANLYALIASHHAWATISADIFSGQIIACSIIVTFVAIFLLREWISQNARPGVFDDIEPVIEAELLPAPEALPVEEPPVQAMPPPEGPVDVVGPPPADEIEDEHGERASISDGESVQRGRDPGPRLLAADPLEAHPSIPSTAPPLDRDTKFDTSAVPERPKFGPHQRRSTSEPPTIGSSPPVVLEPSGPLPDLHTRTPEPDGSDASSTTFHPRPQHFQFQIPNFPKRPTLPASAAPSPLGSPASKFPLGTSPLSSPGLATYRPPEELGEVLATDSATKGKGKERGVEQTGVSTMSTGKQPEDLSELDRYFPIATSSTTSRPVDAERGMTGDDVGNGHPLASSSSDRKPTSPLARGSVEAESSVAATAAPSNSDEDEDGTADEDSNGPAEGRKRVVRIDDVIEHDVVEEELDGEPDIEDDEEEVDGEGIMVALVPGGADGPDEERARLAEEVDRMEEELRELQRERAELEQMEAMLDEDGEMDGFMEVIGLRGRLWVMIQNATLVIFGLDTAIGLGIWLPFMLGKSTALLSLDPPRLLYVLHTPIRIMRFLTDPIIDLGVFVVSRLVMKPLSAIFIAIFGALSQKADTVVDEKTTGAMSIVYQWIIETLQGVLNATTSTTQPVSQGPGSATTTPLPLSVIERFFEQDTPLSRWAEPQFASLGKHVRLSGVSFKAKWVKMALGSGTYETVFAVVLGYHVFGLLLLLYLNVLTVGSMRSAGKAVRNAVRQQLLVAKVGVFVLIELVAFPLGCGAALDLSTIWLCPGATTQTRLDFLTSAPLTCLVSHWIIGTIFMYQFAVTLNSCRRLMRPGALWFIKDPQDQNFHPIRDIIERSSLAQLRKLLLSAEMYLLVVLACVASIGGFLWLTPVLPFRVKIREPLSDVPLDLTLLAILLPYTVRFFRPNKPIRRMMKKFWKVLCAQLRLSSFMLGKRSPSEEFTPSQWFWHALFTSAPPAELQDGEGLRDGRFRRVPANDSVELGQNVRLPVNVDEFGQPLDEQAERLIQAQDAEAIRAGRTPSTDFMVVYIPPHFGARIMLFIAILWIVCSAFIAAAIALPTLFGRIIFAATYGRVVHDGYAFLAGFYALWGAWTVGKSLDRLDKRRQRERDWEGPKAPWGLWVAKRVSRWSVNISYMVFALGIVAPTLIALVVEMYLVLPLRLTMNPGMPIRIRMVDMWMMGILYMKIIVRTRGVQAPSTFIRGVERIARNGWTHPDPWRATTEVIGPLLAGTLAMLLIPAGAVQLGRYLGIFPFNDRFLFMHVYPGMFAAAAMASSIASVGGYYEAWTDGVREAEFLREVRLQNLEPGSVSGEPDKLEQLPQDVPQHQIQDLIAEFQHGEESEEEED